MPAGPCCYTCPSCSNPHPSRPPHAGRLPSGRGGAQLRQALQIGRICSRAPSCQARRVRASAAGTSRPPAMPSRRRSRKDRRRRWRRWWPLCWRLRVCTPGPWPCVPMAICKREPAQTASARAGRPLLRLAAGEGLSPAASVPKTSARHSSWKPRAWGRQLLTRPKRVPICSKIFRAILLPTSRGAAVPFVRRA